MNQPTPTPPSSDVAAVSTRAWRDGALIAQDFPITDVSEHLDADPNVVVWVDLCEPRREQDLAGELYPYYQDVYDHVLRISESSDALRDLGATIVETNLALRDFRQNQAMKRVGSWAAIIAVSTLITGYYGMNVPYPGSGDTTGVVVSAVLALGLPTGLYLYFRHRDWL